MQQSLPELIAQGLAASLTVRVLVAVFSAVVLDAIRELRPATRK